MLVAHGGALAPTSLNIGCGCPLLCLRAPIVFMAHGGALAPSLTT